MEIDIKIPTRIYGKQKTDKKYWIYFVNEKFKIDVPEIELTENKTDDPLKQFQFEDSFYFDFYPQKTNFIKGAFPNYMIDNFPAHITQTKSGFSLSKIKIDGKKYDIMHKFDCFPPYDPKLIKEPPKQRGVLYKPLILDENSDFVDIISDNLEEIKKQMINWKHYIVFDVRTKQFYQKLCGGVRLTIANNNLYNCDKMNDEIYQINLKIWASKMIENYIRYTVSNFLECDKKLLDLMKKVYTRVNEGGCIDNSIMISTPLADMNKLAIAKIDFEDLFLDYLGLKDERKEAFIDDRYFDISVIEQMEKYLTEKINLILECRRKNGF